jgi:hypothetical protein
MSLTKTHTAVLSLKMINGADCTWTRGLGLTFIPSRMTVRQIVTGAINDNAAAPVTTTMMLRWSVTPDTIGLILENSTVAPGTVIALREAVNTPVTISLLVANASGVLQIPSNYVGETTVLLEFQQ